MTVVGQFPLHSDLRRRTIKAPVNPLDKSTIISIYPKKIEERKPTIDPGLFVIEPGSVDKPAILVVGPSSWWKELDDNQPLLEIPHSSVQIAESVVRDYCNGIVGCDMGENMPGLFFIPGAYSTRESLKNYKSETNDGKGVVTFDMLLTEALRKQRNWYNTLVRLGDALWTRSSGNPLSVSEDMRLAAKELHLMNKEWLKDTLIQDLIRCKACGSLRNPEYPICPTCKSIDDPEKAKKLGLVFAQ